MADDPTPQGARAIDELLESIQALLAQVQKLTGPSEPAADIIGVPNPLLAEIARTILQSRQRRARHFDSTLFGEPAWDILLDLFVHKIEGRPVSVTSACAASGVPPSTALRWLGILERKELVARTKAAKDHRVVFVSLTDAGFDAVRAYISEGIQKEQMPVRQKAASRAPRGQAQTDELAAHHD